MKTISCKVQGGRIVASAVPTRDHYSRGTRNHSISRSTADSILSAVAVGKRLALGTVWTGALAPEFDRVLDDLEASSTPLTDPTGNRHLEAEGPGNVLNLGDVYTGFGMIGGGNQAGGLAIIKDAIATAKRRRVARDARGRLTGDFSKPVSPEDLNRIHSEFWAKQEPATPAAAATSVAAAPAASGARPTPAEQNEINRRFWANQAKR